MTHSVHPTKDPGSLLEHQLLWGEKNGLSVTQPPASPSFSTESKVRSQLSGDRGCVSSSTLRVLPSVQWIIGVLLRPLLSLETALNVHWPESPRWKCQICWVSHLSHTQTRASNISLGCSQKSLSLKSRDGRGRGVMGIAPGEVTVMFSGLQLSPGNLRK